MANRELWREVYRLARMTPCQEGANVSWALAYPVPLGSRAITAAWTGRIGDALKWGIESRAFLHRAGFYVDYTINRSASPRLPK